MLQEQQKVFGEKIYPWILVLLPVLAQYKVGPLDMDVIVMGLFFVLAFWQKRIIRLTPINRVITIILAYIVLITAANIAVGEKFSPTSDIVLRAGRYCLYLVIVFFMGNESLSYDRLMKAYRIIAYAATIYILIQAVFYYGAGITLPNRIGGSSGSSEHEVGRLRSFYSEPSVMGYSLVPFVVCNLFGKTSADKKASADAIFVSAGIIISTSGQGILALGVAWVCWCILRMIRGEFKTKDLLLIIGIGAVVVILLKTGILGFALDRASDTKEGGAIDARMSGYEALRVLNPLQLLVGTGFGNYIVANLYGLDVVYEFVNYSSAAEFVFTLGILGSFLWLVFFSRLAWRGNACTRVLLLTMGVLCWSGCPMSGLFFPIWLSLMCLQLPDGQFARKRVSIPENTERGPSIE